MYTKKSQPCKDSSLTSAAKSIDILHHYQKSWLFNFLPCKTNLPRFDSLDAYCRKTTRKKHRNHTKDSILLVFVLQFWLLPSLQSNYEELIFNVFFSWLLKGSLLLLWVDRVGWLVGKHLYKKRNNLFCLSLVFSESSDTNVLVDCARSF